MTQENNIQVELSAKARKALTEIVRLRSAISEAEALKKEAEAVLFAEIVEGQTGLIKGAPAVSIVGRDRKGLDTKALTEAHPEIAQTFETVTHYKVIKTA